MHFLPGVTNVNRHDVNKQSIFCLFTTCMTNYNYHVRYTLRYIK